MHSYTELQQQGYREGSDFRIHTRTGSSGVLVLAPHGGGIEPGTSELARAVAGEEHALYLFEGIQRGDNKPLHITSTHFDEPRCLQMLAETRFVLALHGCNGQKPRLYIGGLFTDARQALQEAFLKAGFPVEENVPPALKGRSPRNICNLGQNGQGLQLELSLGLRRLLFKDLTRAGRQQPTELFEGFVGVCREGIQKNSFTHLL